MLMAALLSIMGLRGGKNSTIDAMMDEHVNVLPGLVHIWFSLLVDLVEAVETVTATDDSECAIGAQNETTTVLFYHVIQRVEDEDIGDVGDGHCTFAVIEAIIREGLIQRILVVLVYVTEGMSNLTDLKDAQPYDRPLVISTVKPSQSNGLSVIIVDIQQESFEIGVVCGIGRDVRGGWWWYVSGQRSQEGRQGN